MRMKQQYTNSCGAASLLCAAQELGVQTIPALDATQSREPLVVSPSAETQLYKITSGSVTGGRLTDAQLSKGGYSMPHNVGIAARELGLDVQFYMSGFIASGVSAFYPDAELNCKRAGFTVIHAEPPPLAANRRALKILMTFGIGLHYVMQRPDGSYMDPGDGKDFADFAQMNGLSKMYNQTGIVLVLERPVPVST